MTRKLSFSSKVNFNIYEFDAPSMHIYLKGACNMNCYGCFNIRSLFKVEPEDWDIDQVITYIKPQTDLFEYIVFTGGEILTAPVDLLAQTILKVRNAFPDKKLILYTNGLEYEKLEQIIDGVDGVHMDLKLPYHLLHPEDEEFVKYTIGRKLTATDLNNLLKSIELVIQKDIGYSQIRTVKYPFTDAEI